MAEAQEKAEFPPYWIVPRIVIVASIIIAGAGNAFWALEAADVVEHAEYASDQYERNRFTAAHDDFPTGREVMALIALDRDIEDYRAYSALGGAAGRYYREQVELCQRVRPLRNDYERLFSAAQAGESEKAQRFHAMDERAIAAYLAKAPFPFSKADFWFTPREELKHAHPYALDVFFKSFRRENGEHSGPKIRSLYPGIVVAAAGDWEGGAGASSYIRGGLSPAAGNGVVVFDRITRRYYVYLHLKDIAVGVGDIVRAGDILGRGGNTGMNARRPDHGGHVHIEIFDCERGTAIRGTEILDIIKR
jgi:murein DD-endopeptidase MepM/ murein hydrolase activator NlpD